MKVKELSLRQARRVCARNHAFCDGCPLNKMCVATYVTDPHYSSKGIGDERVPEKVLKQLKEEGILW